MTSKGQGCLVCNAGVPEFECFIETHRAADPSSSRNMSLLVLVGGGEIVIYLYHDVDGHLKIVKLMQAHKLAQTSPRYPRLGGRQPSDFVEWARAAVLTHTLEVQRTAARLKSKDMTKANLEAAVMRSCHQTEAEREADRKESTEVRLQDPLWEKFRARNPTIRLRGSAVNESNSAYSHWGSAWRTAVDHLRNNEEFVQYCQTSIEGIRSENDQQLRSWPSAKVPPISEECQQMLDSLNLQ